MKPRYMTFIGCLSFGVAAWQWWGIAWGCAVFGGLAIALSAWLGFFDDLPPGNR